MHDEHQTRNFLANLKALLHDDGKSEHAMRDGYLPYIPGPRIALTLKAGRSTLSHRAR
jgi:hypothetical protein